jgi:uncharacterized membrane protein
MIADAASRPRLRPRLRLRLGAIVAFVVGFLLLAGAVHVCTILLIPVLATSDGWSRLDALAGEEQFAEIVADEPGSGVPGLDPLFVNGACRIRLGDAPAAVTTEADDRFWSLALYDPQGTIIFSLNDRTAVDGRLDMLVVSPAQNAALRRAPADPADQRVVVESQFDDLVALLRLFAPTEAARTESRRVLGESECFSEPLSEAVAPSG